MRRLTWGLAGVFVATMVAAWAAGLQPAALLILPGTITSNLCAPNVCNSGGGAPGTVTSVGMTAPAWLTVGGSPITSSGTIAITGTAEAANTALMGPSSGAAAAMAPRLFSLNDMPVGVEQTANKGVANGYTGLDSSAYVASSNLRFIVDSLTASATVPAIGSTVAVTVHDGTKFTANAFVQIGASDYYYVSSISTNTLTIENIGKSTNTAPAGTLSSGTLIWMIGTIPPDIQTFQATTTTWTKPTHAQTVEVKGVGPGGPGGGGARVTSGNGASGGGGGGAGGSIDCTFPASFFGSSETITAQAGTAGGAGATSDNTNGTAGTATSNSTVGSKLTLFAGGGGGAGQAAGANSGGGGSAGSNGAGGNSTSPTGGNAGSTGGVSGGSGASPGSATAGMVCYSQTGAGAGDTGQNTGPAGGNTMFSASGGGAGAGMPTTPANRAGGASGTIGVTQKVAAAGTAGGGNPGSACQAPTNYIDGTGGAGGSNNTSGVGGAGSDACPGGGGGGGGSAVGGNGGAGGKGGDSVIVMITRW